MQGRRGGPFRGSRLVGDLGRLGQRNRPFLCLERLTPEWLQLERSPMWSGASRFMVRRRRWTSSPIDPPEEFSEEAAAAGDRGHHYGSRCSAQGTHSPRSGSAAVRSFPGPEQVAWTGMAVQPFAPEGLVVTALCGVCPCREQPRTGIPCTLGARARPK